MSTPSRPLSARPLDLLYCVFFMIHIPATLSVDLSALFPPALIPRALTHLPKYYLQTFADPVIAGVLGLNGTPASWVWFRSFLVLEITFQLPVFFVALLGLWKGSRSIYPLLLIYSASSATTTIACLATILSTPLGPSPLPFEPFASTAATYPDTMKHLTITTTQRTMLLASYITFLLVPLGMCLDMALRVGGLMEKGMQAEDNEIKGEGSRKAIKTE